MEKMSRNDRRPTESVLTHPPIVDVSIDLVENLVNFKVAKKPSGKPENTNENKVDEPEVVEEADGDKG